MGLLEVQGPLLTQESRVVLECGAAGMLNHEVAQALGMTGQEVRVNVQIAMERLSVTSRLDAIVEAYRRGLISLPAAYEERPGARHQKP